MFDSEFFKMAITELPSTAMMFAVVVMMMKNNEKNTMKITKSVQALCRDIKMAVGNTTLNEEQAVAMIHGTMWKASDRKIKFLEILLHKNDIMNKERTELIKRNIKSTFISETEPVLAILDSFETEVGKISDIIMREDIFKFKTFLSEIYKIFFRKCDCEDKERDTCIEIKIQDVEALMRSTHNKMVKGVKDEYAKLG
jgi:hypothetical protein